MAEEKTTQLQSDLCPRVEDRQYSLKAPQRSLARWPSCVKHQKGKWSQTTSKHVSVCLLSSGGWQCQRERRVGWDTVWRLLLTQEVWKEAECWKKPHVVLQPRVSSAPGERGEKWTAAFREAHLFSCWWIHGKAHAARFEFVTLWWQCVPWEKHCSINYECGCQLNLQTELQKPMESVFF